MNAVDEGKRVQEAAASTAKQAEAVQQKRERKMADAPPRPAADEARTRKLTWKENQEGLNEAYYSHCSFRSPTQAVPAEVNPRNVLYRLFNKQEQQPGGGGARHADQPAGPLPGPDTEDAAAAAAAG